MFNPTWLYTGAVYAGAVWIARRGGIDLPKRVAIFFYALIFVFFFPILTQDAVSTPRDLPIVSLAHEVREGWRSLTPPLWNATTSAGCPLLASPESSALSPLRILGLPLSLEHAMSFEAAMKVLLALTFKFLWCRRRRRTEIASAAGAVAFGLSTFFIARLHFPLTTTACLAPAVFYALELLAERVTYARFVALSFICASMVFGGHLETVLITTLLAVLYALWRSPRVLFAFAGAAMVALLLAAPLLAPFAEAVTKSKRYQELAAGVATPEIFNWFPLLLILSAGIAWAMDAVLPDRQPVWKAGVLFAIIAVLRIAGRDLNPVFSKDPTTPMLRALGDLAKKTYAPFRIVSNEKTVYGYEDVRVNDPMANGRYVGLLSHVIEYDPTEPRWPNFEHPLLDYLNVRYVLTSPGTTLPPRFLVRYDGPDGRLFENMNALPRFFAARNVILDFNDASYANRLKALDWSQTALLDKLDPESPQQQADFFRARSPEAPVATTEILEAKPTDYRLHVRAPRWTLIVSSVPYWPGWKVERNGARIEPIRVNGAFLGFAVPPGQLDVRVWYDPWSFRLGAIVAAATLIALAAYGVRRYS